MLFFSSNSSSDSQVKWCGFWLVCDLSCHQPVWSEGQCYGKPSDSVPRLLDFSWDRDMKGCLIAYQENEINAVPSMYNSMWWHDCLFDFWEYCYPSQQEFLHSSHCCKTKTTNKPNNKQKRMIKEHFWKSWSWLHSSKLLTSCLMGQRFPLVGELMFFQLYLLQKEKIILV